MSGIDVTKLFLPNRLRPPHFDDAVDLFESTDNDPLLVTDLSTEKGDVETQILSVLTDFSSQLSASKSTAASNIAAMIDVVKAQWPFANQAAFNAAMDGLKTDQENEISTTVDIDLTSDAVDSAKRQINQLIDDGFSNVIVNKSDVFVAAKTDVVTALAALAGPDAYPNIDTRCKGTGRYPATDDGDAVTTPKHCVSCDGLGRRKTPNAPVVDWGQAVTFPLV